MERKSWEGARQACVDKEAQLVSVQSREENDFLYGLLYKNGTVSNPNYVKQ